jgi:hypothetical protein
MNVEAPHEKPAQQRALDSGAGVRRETPLQRKIRAAYAVSRQYHDMLAACFPNRSSHRCASHGGPPICAMHFGRALRQMGGYSVGMGSQRMVTLPPNISDQGQPKAVPCGRGLGV